MQLTPTSKLTVSEPLKIFPKFYSTRMFIALSTTAGHWPVIRVKCFSLQHSNLFKTHCHPSTPPSCYCSLSCRSPNQNALACYMRCHIYTPWLQCLLDSTNHYSPLAVFSILSSLLPPNINRFSAPRFRQSEHCAWSSTIWTLCLIFDNLNTVPDLRQSEHCAWSSTIWTLRLIFDNLNTVSDFRQSEHCAWSSTIWTLCLVFDNLNTVPGFRQSEHCAWFST
jgi:hypothetical protein